MSGARALLLLEHANLLVTIQIKAFMSRGSTMSTLSEHEGETVDLAHKE